jgi:beta-galactosidase
MKRLAGYMLVALLVVSPSVVGTRCAAAADEVSPRVMREIVFDWKFHEGDMADAQAADFDDAAWEAVDLPHDFSIRGQVAKDKTTGGSGGWFPAGIGWYRRPIVLGTEAIGRRVFLDFDGVYRNATVYVNGEKVAHHGYGYAPFSVDVTRAVHPKTKNLIAVRVDNSRGPRSRWYSGSGIYRTVTLRMVNDLHIPKDGLTIVTPEIRPQAKVVLAVEVANTSAQLRKFRVETTLIGSDGKPVATVATAGEVAAHETAVVPQTLQIAQPQLWSPQSPSLYRAVSRLSENGVPADETSQRFGVRSAQFDKYQGFLLNGKKTLLQGVCLHHDGGAVGAAVPRDVWRRRLEIIRGMGINALRLAHNPHSTELLDLCDEMGFLVYAEAYDKWKWEDSTANEPYGSFEDTWRDDLATFIRRDRNRPSVIIWSMGNEVGGQNYFDDMRRLTLQHDSTRPVTQALHPGGRKTSPLKIPGYRSSMDVVSLNYQEQTHDSDREKYGPLIIIDSETKPYAVLDWLDKDPTTEILRAVPWSYVRDYLAGQFVWAGGNSKGQTWGIGPP